MGQRTTLTQKITPPMQVYRTVVSSWLNPAGNDDVRYHTEILVIYPSPAGNSPAANANTPDPPNNVVDGDTVDTDESDDKLIVIDD